MDMFDDLPLPGESPPWANDDDELMNDVPSAEDVTMRDASLPEASVKVEGRSPVQVPVDLPPHWAELMEQIRLREEQMKCIMLSRRSQEEKPRGMPQNMPMPPQQSSQQTRSYRFAVPATPSTPIDDQQFRVVPPSGYSLLPPASSSGVEEDDDLNFQPPMVPYPHLPFWTAAPLPFSPNVYPVNVLPPYARESLLAPKAPPNPVNSNFNNNNNNNSNSTTSIANAPAPSSSSSSSSSKKKGGARRSTKGRKARTPNRMRDANGMFVKADVQQAAMEEDSTSHGDSTGGASVAVPGGGVVGAGAGGGVVPGGGMAAGEDTSMLMGRIRELQQQLLRSQYESVMLREQLVHSQMELSQLKDRGLVQASLRGGYHTQPTAGGPANNGPLSGASGPSAGRRGGGPNGNGSDAFRIQLDYNQLKSKLRPTGGAILGASGLSPQDLAEGFNFEFAAENSK